MKTSFLLLLLLLVIGVVAAVELKAVDMPGAVPEGYRLYGAPIPIEDVDHQKIQELGKWAVLEHVKRTNGGLFSFLNRNGGLKFSKVVRGEAQLVQGTNYYLVIEALNGSGEIGMYKARVYDDWTNAPEFASFGPAN